MRFGSVLAALCNAGRVSLPTPHPDRTSLVTGASSGIGRDIARLLAARGFGVTLVARREDRLRELAEDLAGRHGIRAEVIAGDDNADNLAKAAQAGFITADLRNVSWQNFAALILTPGAPLTHPAPHWSVRLARDAGVEVIGDI